MTTLSLSKKWSLIKSPKVMNHRRRKEGWNRIRSGSLCSISCSSLPMELMRCLTLDTCRRSRIKSFFATSKIKPRCWCTTQTRSKTPSYVWSIAVEGGCIKELVEITRVQWLEESWGWTAILQKFTRRWL